MNLVQQFTYSYGKGNDFGLLLLRVVAGLLIFYGHGLEKLETILSGQPIQFLDPIGIGGTTSFYLAFFAEAICALLLIAGLFTRWAALVLSINFLVILYFHGMVAKDGFGVLETRFLYLMGYLTILLLGAGKLSADYLLFKNKSK